MESLTPFAWTLSLAIALLAGVVKGSVGFALPLIMISGLSSFLDPRLALAGILISVLATNGWQVARQGRVSAVEAAQLHWRYLLTVMVAIFFAAQLVTSIPSQTFYLILGIPVVGLSLIQLFGLRLTIPPERRVAAEWGIGLVSGILGGLAGTWGPTTVLYLLAIETPKARQMVVQGVIYGAGSVVLVLAHLRSGILSSDTVWFSAALLPAALIGMAVGFRLQDGMDQALFKKVTLVVLVVAGLNLIRKAFVG
ncbi:sulfite exporter TauE/SafE family protein [Jannaschia sp. M317]|uniref:sulfite exporter TauE/SafE family protein n=1 Tax=Jannaschia sp. M317 TaxID=2867011 RepID=UPI0021A7F8CA|nr:sulfite exporter TauE/SafE family protein [Jannaschia sp. M317]UWQ17381.1 sulfite exporter TauE/SafE family protein [Jannaschia sp. M317]